jgi:hypothetical protein
VIPEDSKRDWMKLMSCSTGICSRDECKLRNECDGYLGGADAEDNFGETEQETGPGDFCGRSDQLRHH